MMVNVATMPNGTRIASAIVMSVSSGSFSGDFDDSLRLLKGLKYYNLLSQEICRTRVVGHEMLFDLRMLAELIAMLILIIHSRFEKHMVF